MAEITLKNQKVIKDYGIPYIIAEVNSSHSGDLDVAKKMIDAAKESGCSCVKFQSWGADSLYSKSYYQANPMAKRFVDKFSLNEDELKEMARYCQSIGIDFSSTPYCKKEVDFLVEECHAPFIKIASMELNNYPYLDYIARKNCPIILSTGMGEMDEIKKAVSTIESAGNKNIIILHCISIYPADTKNMNLNNILGLRVNFKDYPIGFSDHSKGDEAAIAAVALGACVIEKHLTLDSSKIGMDNQMATEPEQMKQLVDKCKTIQLALGSFERIVSDVEKEQRLKMRRSIVAARDLKKGEIIKKEDLDVKRPGSGIAGEKMDEIVGKRLLRDVELDTMLSLEDFEK